MQKKLDKTSADWQMFADFWAMYQKYYTPEQSDAYWNEVVRAASEFTQKHKSEFAQELALAFCDELERRWKNE